MVTFATALCLLSMAKLPWQVYVGEDHFTPLHISVARLLGQSFNQKLPIRYFKQHHTDSGGSRCYQCSRERCATFCEEPSECYGT